jgi:hypothetical protein
MSTASPPSLTTWLKTIFMKVSKALIISISILTFSAASFAQQIADSAFVYANKNPLYQQKKGTVITLDEAHCNYHTLSGRYYTFGQLLEQDGYNLNAGRSAFTSAYLSAIKILVIANALPDTGEWKLPTKSAFTATEVSDVKNWVSSGGSLFLIADHMPFPGAASQLALAFGFNLINSSAVRKDKKAEIFSRERKTLTANKITNGRNKSEQVDSIRIFGGSAFIAPAAATIISKLDDGYNIFLPTTASRMNDTTAVFSGLGLVNGAFMEYGLGRIVVFGEAATFSAQLQGEEKRKMGMNNPQAVQNPQFLLNIIHWLDRKL